MTSMEETIETVRQKWETRDRATHAWGCSSVALQRWRQAASGLGLTVLTEERNVTCTRYHVDDGGPLNAGFLLRDHGLLADARTTCLVAYRREKRVGDMGRGLPNEALLVARKSDRPWT
jgi:hypothetical protein